MTIFIWMYVLLFFIWGISACVNKHKGRKFACVSSFLILWLIQALRSVNTGTDLRSYLPFFSMSSRMSVGEYYPNTNMEWGYQIYNELISHYISTDPTVFLAITAFIAIAPIAYIIYKYSEAPSLSFIIFASLIIYLFDFSGLRQAMAIGITAFSFTYIVKRKVIPSICLVLLASTLHISAILFVIAYPLANYCNLTPKKYAIISAIAVVAIMSLKSIAAYFIELVFGGDKYMGYIEHDSKGAYMLLIMLSLFFLFTFLSNRKENNLIRSIVYIGILTQSLGLISDAATRMGYYFYLYFCLALPETSSDIPQTKSRNIINIGIAAFMVFFFFYTTGDGTMGVVPYKFFWEH